MIDFREIDNINDSGYEIIQDKKGKVYKVCLPQEQHMLRIGKYQMMIKDLQKEYTTVINQGLDKSEKYDKAEELLVEIQKLLKDMFLFIVNMNTEGKVFTMKDIKQIPIKNIQIECENYIKYVSNKLKN